MAEILHHLIGSLSHTSQVVHDFFHQQCHLYLVTLTFKEIPSLKLTYPRNVHFEDDFSFPKAGYVSSLEGINYPSSPSSRLPNWAESIMPLRHFSLLDRELDEPEKSRLRAFRHKQLEHWRPAIRKNPNC